MLWPVAAPLGALSENNKDIWQNQLARHCPNSSCLGFSHLVGACLPHLFRLCRSCLGFSRVAVHVCLTRLDCVVLDLCVKSATLWRELQSC